VFIFGSLLSTDWLAVSPIRLDKMMRLCTEVVGSAGAGGLYAKQAGICWSACCALGLVINPLLAR
jgi:hypothetical protein